MLKKQKKTIEEQSAEGFFRVDKEDLERATEKQVKKEIIDIKQPIEKLIKKTSTEEIVHGAIEKKFSKLSLKQREKVEYKTKTKKRNYKKKDYIPEKIKLNSKGYELIITEKPQAASKIANALGKAIQRYQQKIPYYEVERNNEKIVVACAVGHLLTLKQNKPGTQIPIFDISWVPNYLVKKADFTKKYYDTISTLAKKAKSITVATDYDVEGEVIGLNVVRFICGQEDASRMKFSTLTPKELNEAYEKKSKSINWGQAIAGETRHYLDWFYGINLSRALMDAIKSTGKFKLMSIGRVQGPALNLLVKKEKEIQSFDSKKYWQAFITVKKDKTKLELQHVKDLFEESELKKFENLTGKDATLKTDKSQQFLPPNPPFNLTTLQTEAYKFFGLNPSKTLQIAQSLYLNGLISYPRTSSQKLPDSIAYKEILNQLAKEYKVEKLIKRQKPVEGPKSDPAHPSIYPTGNKQILSGDEKKLYELIVKRFLSLFCEDAIIDNKSIKAEVEDLKFSARGVSINKKSWLEIYPSKLKENLIPDFDGVFQVLDSRTEEKQTQPPKRYSPASLVSQLEKKNLGTKATRANIIETLYSRGYVRGERSIEATPLGISLIETLEKHSPIIIDEKLTRKLETDMEKIIDSKENSKELKKREEEVINKAKESIKKISKDFETKKSQIGKELVEANEKFRQEQKIENTLMKCPKCNKGNLAITYSKKNRRQFVACDAYPECKNTFSLPPNGLIKKTNKICESCNWPMLMRLAKGKKPWIFCFNPECESNKKRIQEYNEKREKQ